MTNKRPILIAAAAAVLLAVAGAAYFRTAKPSPAPVASAVSAGPTAPAVDTSALLAGFKDVLAAYRKIIVLFADEKTLGTNERALANQVGQGLFHENRQRVEALETKLEALVSSGSPQRMEAIGGLLDYVESSADLFDADRLAFRELLRSLQSSVAKDSALPAIKLHKRIGEDLDALAEIERNYEKEIRLVFGRFETRAIDLKRERWQDYLASLKKLYTREQILKDYGVVLPYPAPKEVARKTKSEDEGEIFGNSLPAKTIVLTFDDGPHGVYTAEIAAILRQYSAPAVFFEVGSNLGAVGADGKAKLIAKAEVSRKLLDAGYTLANHSMTHAQLSKQTGNALKTEILDTDELLKAVDARRSPLFRFPYGARNEEGLGHSGLRAHLRSVMWNIDSLDWADPVPSSIVDRVLKFAGERRPRHRVIP